MNKRLILAVAASAMCGSAHAQKAKSEPQPALKWSAEEIKQAVATMRAGRRLSPKSWPGGAKAAVCLSWDFDTETFKLATGDTGPVSLSRSEYGAVEAFPRILELFDRYRIPVTFFVPAVTGVLHPEIIQEFKKRPQHEVGIHGWIHESLIAINDQAEEGRLLNQAIDFWTEALGKKPVGYRAPFWAFSKYTLGLIQQAGFEYDSSAMSMDVPYELLSYGQPTGIVELPISWIEDDAAYLPPETGTLPSPTLVFKVFEEEFDRAYRDGTMFVLTMHPQFSGHRANMEHLEKLIAHMKSKPGVWFATGQEIVRYVKQQDGAFPETQK
jgi:peptidoglycan/xylan/chitin deacetylase (PgdA/CDA1 family)